MSHPHHHHHHEGCGHEHAEHDHSHDEEGGSGGLLYSKIDLPNVAVLNSESPASNAIKPWDKRLDDSVAIESDADNSLIVKIPFTGTVKLRSILIRSGPESQTPSKLVLFANAQDLDFSDAADAKPSEELNIVQTSDIVEYTVKPARFSNIRSITLFVPEVSGADETRISYIGFKGEFSELKEQPIITVYEAQANPADHQKIKGTDGALSRPGV